MKQLLLFSIIVLFTGCGIRKNMSVDEEYSREAQAQQLLLQATLYMRDADTKSLQKAEAALELAREILPEDPRVLDGLGCVAWRREEYSLAEFFFRWAVEKNSNYDRGYAHLALVAKRNGDHASAAKLLKMATLLNPLNYRARNNYAALLLEHSTEPLDWKQAQQQLLVAGESGQQQDGLIEYNTLQANRRVHNY